MTINTNAQKLGFALHILENSSMFVELDPRHQAVHVPEQFHKLETLVLQVGLNMVVQIPDLKVDESGISCTLSFNRKQIFCVVPWEAVIALFNEDRKGIKFDSTSSATSNEPMLAPKKYPPLRLVK